MDAELAAALSDHNVLVGPMTDDEMLRAIERPAQLVGCELEAGFVDLLPARRAPSARSSATAPTRLAGTVEQTRGTAPDRQSLSGD